ncbi:MAG: hypothetical protein NVSMB65_05980 [Chloroflexota bacterium]
MTQSAETRPGTDETWRAWLGEFDNPHPLEITDLYTYTSSLVSYMARDALGTGEYPRVTFELYFGRVPQRAVAGIRVPYLIVHGIHELAARLSLLENPRTPLVDRLKLNPILGAATAEYWSTLAEGVERLRHAGPRTVFEMEGLRPGEVHFPSLHPVLRLTAPYHLAARLEPLIISTLLPYTYGATYAANLQDILEGWNHMHPQAPPRIGLEFGLRRGLGPHAATAVSIGAYVGGIYGTSNTQTGLFADTNLLGTVAHNLMQLFMPGTDGVLDYRDAAFSCWDATTRAVLDEVEPGQEKTYRQRMDWESLAFVAIAEAMRERSVFLLDTVDTIAAAHKLVWLYHKGLIGQFIGVRLDSGDLPELANRCAYLFDAAGMPWVKIFASNEISLVSLPRLLGSRIDTVAVGTNFERSDLSAVFKEVEVVRQDRHGALHHVPVYKIDQDDLSKSYYPGQHHRVRLTGHASNGTELFMGDLMLLPEEASRRLEETWTGPIPDHEHVETLMVPYLTAAGPADWLRKTNVEALHKAARAYTARRRGLIPWSNSGYPVVASRGAQRLLEERETSLLANSFVPR